MLVNKINTRCNENCWLLLGIPIIIIMGVLLHFAYQWSNNLPLIGLISPVNESVWEHLKLTFFPTLFWWSLGYFIYKDSLALNNWLCSLAITLITAPMIIVVLHYISVSVLGKPSVVIDILIFIFAVIISQLIGLVVYNYINCDNTFSPLLLIALLVIIFVIFTYYPPNLPLFVDQSTGNTNISQ